MFPQLSNIYDLAMSFAFQLETNGHWEWAIYIILNLPEHKQLAFTFHPSLSPISWIHTLRLWRILTDFISVRLLRLREMAIKSILSRHAYDFTTKEQFLTQRLRIPSDWLEEASVIENLAILECKAFQF
jgi:hypothetical protein